MGLSIAAIAFGQGFGRFTYTLLLPDMRDDVLDSYGLAGLLGTVNLAAYLLGLVLVSWFGSRISVVRVVWVGLALCTVGSLALGLAPGFAMLAAGMFLLGLGSAGTWVPLAGVVTASVSSGRRGLALGLLTTGFGGSILLAAQLRSLVYAIEGPGSWRIVWLVQGVLVGVTCLACAALFRPGAAATEPFVGRPTALVRTVPGWAMLTLAYVAVAVGYMLFITYLAALLQKEAGFSPAHTSAVFSVIGVTSIVGGVGMGRLADRVGWRLTLMAACTAMALCGVLVLARDEPWVALAAVLYGLPLTATGSLIAGYLSDHLRGAAIGAAFGLITIPFGVVQAIVPWIGGWLRDTTESFTSVFLLSAAAFAGAALFSLMLPARVARGETVTPGGHSRG
jgi:predicted MFS family arabinose efflux permease